MKPLETISQEVADIARQQRPVYATVMGALIEAREPLLKEIQQLQEENQRLKEALDDAISMWDKLDIYMDYEQEIKEARKLIEP